MTPEQIERLKTILSGELTTYFLIAVAGVIGWAFLKLVVPELWDAFWSFIAKRVSTRTRFINSSDQIGYNSQFIQVSEIPHRIHSMDQRASGHYKMLMDLTERVLRIELLCQEEHDARKVHVDMLEERSVAHAKSIEHLVMRLDKNEQSASDLHRANGRVMEKFATTTQQLADLTEMVSGGFDRMQKFERSIASMQSELEMTDGLANQATDDYKEFVARMESVTSNLDSRITGGFDSVWSELAVLSKRQIEDDDTLEKFFDGKFNSVGKQIESLMTDVANDRSNSFRRINQIADNQARLIARINKKKVQPRG